VELLKRDHRKRRRIFISSLPKSGTHLVTKCLSNVEGLKDGYHFLDRRLSASQGHLTTDPNRAVIIGVDDPRFIKKEVVESILRRIGNNRYISGHIPYTKNMEDILDKYGYRCIAIIRDPRDVVVSHVHFLLRTEDHYLHDYYHSLQDFDKCLMQSIIGYQDATKGLKVSSIVERVKSISAWDESPICYLTRFEDLIGERGGGSAGKQRKEILLIAEHIGISLSNQKVLDIMEKMFGGSHTFRKGQIGDWKEAFKEEHKEACKAIAGDLLIELGYEKNMEW